MHLEKLIVDLALILIVASIVTLIMRKLKQPVVMGYIIAGFLISPNFNYLPSIVTPDDITAWAEMGIIFLMFSLGLEFSFKKIANVGGSAFITVITAMSAMILIGFSAGKFMGWSNMDCIFLGGMLSMSSTMIILKAYEEYKLKKEKFAQLVLGTLVLEDIAGIFMMIILTTISVSQSISGIELVSEIGVLLLMLVVWLIVGIYIIPTILKKINSLLNNELLIMVSLAICMGMVMIANKIGFSSALGAFVGGSILAGTVKSDKIERLMNPIKDLFGAVFFVSVGMLIVPETLVQYAVPIIIITLVTIAGHMIFITLGMLFSGQTLKTAISCGFSMVQIGEFSFIVASLGMSLGVISEFIYPIVVCVSVITSFTTPLFIKNADRAYKFLDRKLPSKARSFLKKNTSESQVTDDKDKDWKVYLKKIGWRVFICTTAMFMIYWIGIGYLEPWLAETLNTTSARWITVSAVIGLMIPFAVLMHGLDKVLFTKLWLKHRANKLPLLTLQFMRVLIADIFIAMALNNLLGVSFIMVILMAIAPTYWLIKSDYLRGKTKSMEMSFVANFYEKTLAMNKKEKGYRGVHHWMDESMQVVRFRIIDGKDNVTVRDIGRNRHVHVGVIKVIRENKHFNMPNGMFRLERGDIIHTMGTMKEVEASLMMLERMECIEEINYPKESLKDYIYGQTFKHISPENQIICLPIRVQEGSPFAKKSIKNSSIREKYKGSVIGIERANLPITHPNIATVIQPGDLLWLIGTNSMASKLLKNDLL